jgi:hypothetical protein
MPRGLGAFLLPLYHVMFLSTRASIKGRAPFPDVAGERFIFATHILVDKLRSHRQALQGFAYPNSIQRR